MKGDAHGREAEGQRNEENNHQDACARVGRSTDLDTLTQDEIQAMKAQLWTPPAVTAPITSEGAPVLAFAFAPTKPSVVAEGDSWFDYPPGLDILFHLRRLGYPISSVAHWGDTLENMTYGSDINRDADPRPPEINATLALIQRVQPKFFLFSAGGNDVAGAELESYLDHHLSPTPGLRMAYVNYVFGTVVKDQYRYMINQVKAVKPDIHIVIHGYGYAIPDGRAVLNFPFGFRFLGPWLKPSLVAKGFTALTDGKTFVRTLVDMFNKTLADIAAANANIHYIDLRNIIKTADWVNELHLRNSAYQQVAAEFDRVMSSV